MNKIRLFSVAVVGGIAGLLLSEVAEASGTPEDLICKNVIARLQETEPKFLDYLGVAAIEKLTPTVLAEVRRVISEDYMAPQWEALEAGLEETYELEEMMTIVIQFLAKHPGIRAVSHHIFIPASEDSFVLGALTAGHWSTEEFDAVERALDQTTSLRESGFLSIDTFSVNDKLREQSPLFEGRYIHIVPITAEDQILGLIVADYADDSKEPNPDEEEVFSRVQELLGQSFLRLIHDQYPE